jgi:hypothetical protein
VLRTIFGPKREVATGGWRRWHNEELHDRNLNKQCYGDQMKESTVNGSGGTHAEETCIEGFGGEA